MHCKYDSNGTVPNSEELSSGHELSKSGPRDFFFRSLDFFLASLLFALSGVLQTSFTNSFAALIFSTTIK